MNVVMPALRIMSSCFSAFALALHGTAPDVDVTRDAHAGVAVWSAIHWAECTRAGAVCNSLASAGLDVGISAQHEVAWNDPICIRCEGHLLLILLYSMKVESPALVVGSVICAELPYF